MQTHRMRNMGIALAMGALVACGDAGPGDVESVDIEMQQTDQMLAQATAGWFASVAGTEGQVEVVDPAAVASLMVRITAIEFLPAVQEGNEDDPGAWVSVELGSAVEVDLMALPTAGESPLVIASGAAPVNDYVNVRLFVDQSTIRFATPITLGFAFSFEADTDYTVDIPSGAETGIKTGASFSVTADAEGNVNDVPLLFSPSATFLNVTGTGTGTVILAPVIRGQPEPQS